jgi:Uma2 family endonuclease
VSPTEAVPRTERRWTVDELDELPDDEVKYECLDGRLVAMTPATAWHQKVAKRLLLQLDPQLPAGWDLLWECGLQLGTDWRIPDLLVVPADVDPTQRLFHPSRTPLVIEVASESTRRTDRIVKPAEYADAGIGCYWRVETEPRVQLAAYVLDGRRYADPAVFTAGTATPWAPFPLVVDLDALGRR